MTIGIQITGTGSYLPPHILTNEMLSRMVDTSDEWIVEHTGIKQRHMAGEETTWQMGLKAAVAALEMAGIDPMELDAILCATITQDYFFPSVAALIQRGLGARNAFAMDINAACSGFIFALETAHAFIQSGRNQKILIVCSESLTKLVDFTDRSTCILFGDGAGAAVVEWSQEEHLLGEFLATDGTGAMALHNQAAPARPVGKLTEKSTIGPLTMNGREVFRFAVRAMPHALKEACKAAGITMQQLDWIIPHQANQRIIQSSIERFGLDADKVISRIAEHGNTSSASIPLCLDELARSGKLSPGQLVGFVGFGAGLTSGANIIRWSK